MSDKPIAEPRERVAYLAWLRDLPTWPAKAVFACDEMSAMLLAFSGFCCSFFDLLNRNLGPYDLVRLVRAPALDSYAEQARAPHEIVEQVAATLAPTGPEHPTSMNPKPDNRAPADPQRLSVELLLKTCAQIWGEETDNLEFTMRIHRNKCGWRAEVKCIQSLPHDNRCFAADRPTEIGVMIALYEKVATALRESQLAQAGQPDRDKR